MYIYTHENTYTHPSAMLNMSATAIPKHGNHIYNYMHMYIYVYIYTQTPIHSCVTNVW